MNDLLLESLKKLKYANTNLKIQIVFRSINTNSSGIIDAKYVSMIQFALFLVSENNPNNLTIILFLNWCVFIN